ncbi:hypothetical protein [Alteraurantiacibacter aquimixticola]|uniref:Uncharacterized protein n=1 Tax=Alteraurantiacibacter aquimixticola TaxID=2489173 RepID=A0A4T3F4J0_9SPHN|nr:hypothetical protein [Alteraurantiacibacter aquimixticola]TIX51369.1 hypothetical protein E5222_02570 [Alteraurantiacibacter aquimixticola]
MTPQARIRRIGWLALLAICTALYGVLHFQVWSVQSEVTRAERRIVALEEQNLLLETEFLTRSSQMQLAAWNRVDFGYSAPAADQFIENERQLSRFASARPADAVEPVLLASQALEEDNMSFAELVSPITGERLDPELVRPRRDDDGEGTTLIAAIAERSARVPLSAAASAPTTGAAVRIALGGGGK